MDLGRLEPVDLREVWNGEASHFTPWLATEANLALLSDALRMELEFVSREVNVGQYRADLLCRDLADGTQVLIENQLAKTDHSHLGQLLTYAAKLDAVTVVWIAERFTDEHRAALDWLNEVTHDKISFFGLEIELWRIGSSSVAPKFNIVCKPNDWTKAPTVTASTELTETNQLQLEYWKAFRDYLAGLKSPIRPPMPRPQHWLPITIGRSNTNLNAIVNTKEDRIGVDLYLSGPLAKDRFRSLHSSRDSIEAKLGELDWRELPEKAASRIVKYKHDESIRRRDRWPDQHAWLAETLTKFTNVFRPLVRDLPDGAQGAGE